MYTIFDRANARPAPDGSVLTPEGEPVRLHEIWAAHDLTALIFTRHFGCIFCRQQIEDLKHAAGDLERAGLTIVIIGPADPEHALQFIAETQPPFPVYCDPDGVVFQAYGLADSRALQTLRLEFARATVRALAGGARPRRPMGRPKQLPGAAIVGREGRLRLHQIAQHPADHLTGADLIDAIFAIRQVDHAASVTESA